MPDMQDFPPPILADASRPHPYCFNARQNGIANATERFCDEGRAVVRVGSPDPSAIMRRRQRVGTGGVGSR